MQHLPACGAVSFHRASGAQANLFVDILVGHRCGASEHFPMTLHKFPGGAISPWTHIFFVILVEPLGEVCKRCSIVKKCDKHDFRFDVGHLKAHDTYPCAELRYVPTSSCAVWAVNCLMATCRAPAQAEMSNELRQSLFFWKPS